MPKKIDPDADDRLAPRQHRHTQSMITMTRLATGPWFAPVVGASAGAARRLEPWGTAA